MLHTKNKAKAAKNADGFAKLEEKPRFALVESFRNLTTNIGFAVPKKKDGSGRLICISSAVAGEGKSTVSVNLALSCANTGSRTILLDCDMRRPSVRKFFDIKNETGMTDYLSGEASLAQALNKEVAPNLDVIVCRKTAPNPLALLQGENFTQLLEKLAMDYDYVFIDTPPIGIVSDALAVAAKTDGILLVVRQMMSDHTLIRRAISDITFSGVNFLGFVLNDFNLKKAGNGYYKKYSYKYKNKY